MGGIIRDRNGRIIRAFGDFMDSSPPIFSAWDVLESGLRICWDSGIHINSVEISSQTLFQVLTGIARVPWKLMYRCGEIRSLLPPSTNFSCILKVDNAVAEALASLALVSKEEQIFPPPHTISLPPLRRLYTWSSRDGEPVVFRLLLVFCR